MCMVQSQLTYEQIRDYFREASDPVLTAGEIADAFNISQQGANYRLKRMVDGDDLERKKVGGAAAVYWLSEKRSESR